MEYYAYKPRLKWWIMEVFKLGVICLAVAKILYDRIWMSLGIVPMALVILKGDIRMYKIKTKEMLNVQFGQVLTLVSGNLNAGYSLEQGIKKAYQDISHSDDFDLMRRELALVVNGINLNKSPEELLLEFGDRCQLESVVELAGLISIAKRCGGNLNQLIAKANKNLKDRKMVEKEIETMISAKKLEGYIMLFMPFAIVLYMRFTNSAYISTLYDSLVGNIVTTVALVVVMVCGYFIKRITKIEV